MALLSPADRRYVITQADHQNYKLLGDASSESVGAWSVCFAPDDFWVGSLTVVGRHRGKDSNTDAAGFGTLAYLRVQLNGAAADYELVPDLIEGHATILIPTNGLSVALAIECTAGSGVLYTTPLQGSVAPFFHVVP